MRRLSPADPGLHQRSLPEREARLGIEHQGAVEDPDRLLRTVEPLEEHDGLAQERQEAFRVERPAGAEISQGRVGLLQRDSAKRSEAIRMVPSDPGQKVVHPAMERQRHLDRPLGVKEHRRRAQCGDVDAPRVHDRERPCDVPVLGRDRDLDLASPDRERTVRALQRLPPRIRAAQLVQEESRRVMEV